LPALSWEAGQWRPDHEYEVDCIRALCPRPGPGDSDGDGVAPLGQRAATLLAALVEADGRVLSKWELLDRVWPDAQVEEGNLAVQIATLRKCLGRSADGRDWIVTVPRVGYRFLPLANGRSSLIETPPMAPSIAVLPFEMLAQEEGDRYFADGVAADLVAALARFRSLRLISFQSSRSACADRSDPRAVAAELGADYLLQGSLRRQGRQRGERLRITVQLAVAATAQHLWAESFEGGPEAIFDFQDRITERVVTPVEPEIKRLEIERSRRERPRSFATYDIYLRSLALLMEETPEGNAAAHVLLEQTLAQEPDNAVILAHAAWALEHRHSMGWPPIGPDDVARCVGYARRGLQHAAGDARVMAQCGMALLQTGKDYEAGLSVIQLAAATNPHDLFVNAAAGIATLHCGEIDLSLDYMRRAIALGPRDPDSRFSMTGLAMAAIIGGRDEEALGWASRSLALNAHFDATYWMLISAHAHLGRLDYAKNYLKALLELVPDVTLARIRAGQPAKYGDRTARLLRGLELAGMPAG
jgi:TolB-like protein/Tfp pilus assembly protein PilF